MIRKRNIKFSTERVRASTEKNRDDLIETDSDRGRIVHSAPFQRMQQKAQVFPLEINAAVRTRLTHSIEVSHNGRYLTDKIFERIPRNLTPQKKLAIRNTVESACLLHDIGNPPFGHFGESAISDWFSRFGAEIANTHFGNQAEAYLQGKFLDFKQFDGNPQGLRIVAKLQGDDTHGLNLTYSLLASLIKYPCSPRTSKKNDPKSPYKKPGWFSSEEGMVRSVFQKLGIEPMSRYWLSYVMEAADDISYILSDVEDGLHKNCLTEEEFFDLLSEDLGGEGSLRKQTKKLLRSFKLEQAGPVNKFVKFRTKTTNAVVERAAEIFCANFDDYLGGSKQPILDEEFPEFELLDSVRKIVVKKVFRSSQAEAVELSGYRIVFGLLEKFERLLRLDRASFNAVLEMSMKEVRDKGLDYELRLANLISDQHRRAYSLSKKRKNIDEYHCRSQMIVDYISGMTDMYALETFQLLEGIKIARS